jgi:steroid delta-isomerase-like uncharacterized protein
MSSRANSQIVKDFAADYRTLNLAETVVVQDQAQARAYSGRAAAEGLLRAFYADGFSDSRMDVRCIIADESTAVLEFTFQGRHTGLFVGIPPTGREVTLPMAIICEIFEGRICRARLYYDTGTLLRQLGLAL